MPRVSETGLHNIKRLCWCRARATCHYKRCFGILHKILTQLSCAGESDFLNIPSSTQQFAGMDARKSPIRAWMASRGRLRPLCVTLPEYFRKSIRRSRHKGVLCNMPFCPSNPTHLSPPSPPAIPYFPPESDLRSLSRISPPAAAHVPHKQTAPWSFADLPDSC